MVIVRGIMESTIGYKDIYYTIFSVDVPQWVEDMANFRADHDLLRCAEVYTSLAVYGRV